MQDRKGVILLFFDLPAVSGEEKRSYRNFRKYIKKSGYIFIQESVYVKLIHNISSSVSEFEKLRDNVPPGSSVYILPLSLGNFKNMMAVSGEEFDFSFFSDDIVVI